MNRRVKWIGIIFSIILILILVFVTLKETRVGRFSAEEQFSAMQQLEKGIHHSIYQYDWRTLEGNMLVQIADSDNGIDTVTCPDGTVINCYGRNQLSIDWPIQNDNTYSFTAVTNASETIQKDIIINQESIQSLIQFDVSEEYTNLTLNIDYHQYENKFYKFDETGEWIQYKGEFSILAEDVVKDGGYEEETKTSTIYLKGVDDLGNEVLIKKKLPIKAEMPKVNLIFRNAVIGTDIDAMKRKIKEELAQNNISAGLMEISLGAEEVLDSNADDAKNIFDNWGRVGYTGQWIYDSSLKAIVNKQNTDNFTGFYYKDRMDYNEIELEYKNTTTNSDDDMMGCMTRFNIDANKKVDTYVFALDRHDNGGRNK